MAHGNLSRIGKKVHLTELASKGGSLDIIDFFELQTLHSLAHDTGHLFTGDFDYGFGYRYKVRDAFRPFFGHKIDLGGGGNTTTNRDYDGPYHVSEMFFDMGAPNLSTHLYIGHQHTLSSGNQWCNDTSIAGLQVLNLDGEVVHNISVDSSTWKYYSVQYDNSSMPTPSALSNITSWSTLMTNGALNSWSYKVLTGSYRTGARNGIDNSDFDDQPFPLTRPESDMAGTIPQDATEPMLYREVSSSLSYGKTQFIKSNTAYAMPRYGSFRIAYANATESVRYTDLDEDSTLFIGAYQ